MFCDSIKEKRTERKKGIGGIGGSKIERRGRRRGRRRKEVALFASPSSSFLIVFLPTSSQNPLMVAHFLLGGALPPIVTNRAASPSPFLLRFLPRSDPLITHHPPSSSHPVNWVTVFCGVSFASQPTG